MKAEFINPFLASLINTLETMANFKCRPGKLSIKRNDEIMGDITGIIGMVDDNLQGTFSISFPARVACDIYKNMLHEVAFEVDERVSDMVGELVNIITGGAKKLLQENGYEFGMATPTVVRGKGHSVGHKRNTPILVLPFHSLSGVFYIEVCFHDGKSKGVEQKESAPATCV